VSTGGGCAPVTRRRAAASHGDQHAAVGAAGLCVGHQDAAQAQAGDIVLFSREELLGRVTAVVRGRRRIDPRAGARWSGRVLRRAFRYWDLPGRIVMWRLARATRLPGQVAVDATHLQAFNPVKG